MVAYSMHPAGEPYLCSDILPSEFGAIVGSGTRACSGLPEAGGRLPPFTSRQRNVKNSGPVPSLPGYRRTIAASQSRVPAMSDPSKAPRFRMHRVAVGGIWAQAGNCSGASQPAGPAFAELMPVSAPSANSAPAGSGQPSAAGSRFSGSGNCRCASVRSDCNHPLNKAVRML